MTTPTIDIVIATYKGYPQLQKCVTHITSSSKTPNKLIIIDNNPSLSENDRLIIIQKCQRKNIKLDYVFKPNIGLSNARNEGVSLVTSSHYAFIDQDEYVPTTWIAKLKYQILKHPDMIVITGPKKSTKPRNYWKIVWDSLYQDVLFYDGIDDFATSSNSCYRTDFIRQHHLKYDSLFTQSSEDTVFCHLLKEHGGKIFFSKDIWLWHDFRSSLFIFCKQWFNYGYTTELFFYKYLPQSHLSDFLLSNIKKPHHLNWFLIPGIIIMNLSFISGFIVGYFQHKFIK